MNGTLLALLAVGALAWLWQHNLQIRERATRLARETCKRQELQLLEGTVALASARPCRGPNGRLALRRTYLFEYSEDGASRQRGYIVFSGGRLEGVGLAAPGGPG
ncbi:MAG TPA: DUF3301 domain-containing protein [Gammaproteobacteria bacterium]